MHVEEQGVLGPALLEEHGAQERSAAEIERPERLLGGPAAAVRDERELRELAAQLAEHFHAPAVQIAQAISTRNLRAGQAMEPAALRERLAHLGLDAAGGHVRLRAGADAREVRFTGASPSRINARIAVGAV